MRSSPHSVAPVPSEQTELAVLGEFSFSHEAGALMLEGLPGASLSHQDSIGAVWNRVNEHGAYGVIPVENSSGGVVLPHLDSLSRGPYTIIAEVNLRVRICAGMREGSLLDQAQTVYSHAKGLEQCTEFIERHGLTVAEAMHSTVAAVQYVALHGTESDVALGSRQAVEHLGLQIPDGGDDVANMKGDRNITQFYVVRKNGHDVQPNPDAQRHAVILRPKNRRGVLHRITGIIAEYGVTMTSLHSRAVGPKEYSFFIEMTREGTSDAFAAMVRELQACEDVEELMWLGSWDKQYEN